MDMRTVSSVGLLLCHLLIAGVCQDCASVLDDACKLCLNPGVLCASSCPKPQVCVSCTNVAGCITASVPSSCRKQFSVNINSSNSNPKEGDKVVLTCVNNLPDKDPSFSWSKDGVAIGGNNISFVLNNVLSSASGSYNCSVNSVCGSYSAQYNLNVPNNSVIILVVCGVAALVLVLIMGLAMKFKLKRDNAKHRERRKQREQIGQSGGQAPFTIRQT